MQTRLSRKILAPALLAMAIAPLALQATAAPGDGERAENRQQWQEARAERHAEKRAALYERAGLDAETREALDNAYRKHGEAMMELRDEHRERVDELLSDDQQAALDEARREMHETYRTEKHQRHAGALQKRMIEMVDGWDLSDEDREALGDLRREHYADMAELRDRDFDSREERREAHQALRDEHQEALGELLSEEQIEEMQQVARQAFDRDRGNGPRSGNAKD
ncbi:MAG: hypothetical protein HLX48_04680 [Halomonas sp.]|uniref:hypothetical protein n=1 Tax=Halomonas TaxID=2745 RepID=UPI000687A269|nr:MULTISPECIES: hypothetical protein [Halomonas]NWN82283.1 hypothetical protein [Halomonas sp.]